VGALAAALAAAGQGWGPRRALAAALVALWALRLCVHIVRDRVLPGIEDGRYRYLRAYWGAGAKAWFFVFFTLQSLLVVLFALPFVPIAAHPRAGFAWWEWGAVALWLLCIAGEVLADRQLRRFRSDPAHRGRTCRTGLWGWSRHPNYFCEWLHWWAYVLLAAGAPGWWLSLAGPAAMYVFLRYLTGIPHVERQALQSRGDDYRDYQRRVNVFFPGPQRGPR
jgi:steroid 5-alpha reductase family enzyme